jgi:hypothetical protein
MGMAIVSCKREGTENIMIKGVYMVECQPGEGKI